MLRISTSENESEVVLALEGRVAGPWVEELVDAWQAMAPRRGERKLKLDLRGVTFSDDSGTKILREIYCETGAELLARTVWTEHLASKIRSGSVPEIA